MKKKKIYYGDGLIPRLEEHHKPQIHPYLEYETKMEGSYHASGLGIKIRNPDEPYIPPYVERETQVKDDRTDKVDTETEDKKDDCVEVARLRYTINMLLFFMVILFSVCMFLLSCLIISLNK